MFVDVFRHLIHVQFNRKMPYKFEGQVIKLLVQSMDIVK